MQADLEEDAIVLTFTRNLFYRQKYQLLLAVHLLGLIGIALLTGMLIYILKNPTSPLYFATDNAGRFIHTPPVQQPNMKLEEAAAWAIEAVQAAMSYDYINYRGQLQSAEKYFTEYGWRSYMRGLTQSNNLIALKDRRQIVVAKVIEAPKLDAQGPLGAKGAYSYKFTMPVLVSYLSPPYNNVPNISLNQNALLVSVIVQRQEVLNSYKGLGIIQLIAKQAAG